MQLDFFEMFLESWLMQSQVIYSDWQWVTVTQWVTAYLLIYPQQLIMRNPFFYQAGISGGLLGNPHMPVPNVPQRSGLTGIHQRASSVHWEKQVRACWRQTGHNGALCVSVREIEERQRGSAKWQITFFNSRAWLGTLLVHTFFFSGFPPHNC